MVGDGGRGVSSSFFLVISLLESADISSNVGGANTLLLLLFFGISKGASVLISLAFATTSAKDTFFLTGEDLDIAVVEFFLLGLLNTR